jgi:hypothetical protein
MPKRNGKQPPSPARPTASDAWWRNVADKARGIGCSPVHSIGPQLQSLTMDRRLSATRRRVKPGSGYAAISDSASKDTWVASYSNNQS